MGMLWMRQWSIATGPVSAASRFIAIRQRTANGAGVTSSSSSSGILVVCCDICFFLRLSCLCPSSLGYHQESRDAEVRWEMRWRRRRFSSDVSGRCDCFVQNYRILLRQWVAAPPLSVRPSYSSARTAPQRHLHLMSFDLPPSAFSPLRRWTALLWPTGILQMMRTLYNIHVMYKLIYIHNVL